jgi:hypothetical protein
MRSRIQNLRNHGATEHIVVNDSICMVTSVFDYLILNVTNLFATEYQLGLVMHSSYKQTPMYCCYQLVYGIYNYSCNHGKTNLQNNVASVMLLLI